MIDIEYQLKKSPRRRTISIHIHPDCSIRVLAPSSLADEQVSTYVDSKRRWIEAKIACFRASRHLYLPKQYVNGSSFDYLGHHYRLKIISGDGRVRLMSGRFLVPVPETLPQSDHAPFIRQQLSNWYAEHALSRMQEKTLEYAKRLDCYPGPVAVKGYRSRWGCCFADGRIIYNWRLIMAPVRVIDYVIVHELAHLKQRNHSKRFYNEVGSVVPDYKDQRQWLRHNGHHLQV